MQLKFNAQQRMLGLTECERLLGRGAREVGELAYRAGWHGFPGAPVSVSIGTALNMLVLSTAMNHHVELRWMADHLPGLRNEGLLKLGEDYSNWSFDGPYEAEQQFWPMLYGESHAGRPCIAPLLGASSSVIVRQLRFFSPSDVERLSPSQFEEGHSSRAPRFTIDAHSLAGQVQRVCGGSMFTARLAMTG